MKVYFHGSCSNEERFQRFFLRHTASGNQLWFQSLLSVDFLVEGAIYACLWQQARSQQRLEDFLVVRAIHTSWDTGADPDTHWWISYWWELSIAFLASGIIEVIWPLPTVLEEAASAHLWSPRLTPTPGAPVGSVLLSGSTQWKKTLWWSLPALCLPPNNAALPVWQAQVSLPSTPSVATVWPLQAVSTPLPGPELWSLNFRTWPTSQPTEPCVRLERTRWQCRPPVQVTLRFAFLKLVTILSSWAPNFSFVQACLPDSEEIYQGAGNVPALQLPPWSAGPIMIPSVSFSFCPTRLWGVFLVVSYI